MCLRVTFFVLILLGGTFASYIWSSISLLRLRKFSAIISLTGFLPLSLSLLLQGFHNAYIHLLDGVPQVPGFFTLFFFFFILLAFCSSNWLMWKVLSFLYGWVFFWSFPLNFSIWRFVKVISSFFEESATQKCVNKPSIFNNLEYFRITFSQLSKSFAFNPILFMPVSIAKW